MILCTFLDLDRTELNHTKFKIQRVNQFQYIWNLNGWGSSLDLRFHLTLLETSLLSAPLDTLSSISCIVNCRGIVQLRASAGFSWFSPTNVKACKSFLVTESFLRLIFCSESVCVVFKFLNGHVRPSFPIWELGTFYLFSSYACFYGELYKMKEIYLKCFKVLTKLCL